MKIFCVACEKEISARLTDGEEAYPHREDLHTLPFWKCDACGNHVGCHHKNGEIAPLGCIPTKELKKIRMEIHRKLDPLWQSGMMPRKEIYSRLSKVIGRPYHTGDTRSVQECKVIIEHLSAITLTQTP